MNAHYPVLQAENRHRILNGLSVDVGACASTTVPLEDAIGSIAAQRVENYPPGIPVILHGHPISEDAVAQLSDAYANVTTAGPWTGKVRVVPHEAVKRYLDLRRRAS